MQAQIMQAWVNGSLDNRDCSFYEYPGTLAGIHGERIKLVSYLEKIFLNMKFSPPMITIPSTITVSKVPLNSTTMMRKNSISNSGFLYQISVDFLLKKYIPIANAR